jgi:universal stress protein A
MKTTASEKTAAVMGRIKSSYPRIQHILVPLDFSGKSRQALRYAVPLAEKFAAVDPPRPRPPAAGQVGAGRPAPPQARGNQAARRDGRVPAAPRLRTGNAVLVGKPADEILALARRNNIDLIVLTTKGRTGLARALVGSTAESIMRHAPCPVLSVRRR